jgi:zinc protease
MRNIFSAILLIFCISSVNAQILPLDKNVRTGKLPNGFTYFIRHNTEPKHRVYLYLVNKAGSILEDEDQRGLAHFMEHMSFNGTKHYPKNELVDYLQKIGVRFGADLNAYTSFDETVYQLPIPTDNPAILKNGFQIMRDWAQEATLDPVEINKERGVVLEEKRLGKGAEERMERLTLPLMLNNSRYAVRSPIGIDTVLDNFKPEAIRRFYKDWYRPDLQALVVVGDIDVNKTEALIKSQFGTLKNPVHEKARLKYKADLTGKNQFLVVTDPEMTATVGQVLIKHRARKLRSEDDYRQTVKQQLFNQMLGERYQELSRQAVPAYIDGGAGIQGFMAGLDSYTATVQAKPGELENGFKAVWRETVRLQRYGFTQTEMDRAKQTYLAGMDAALKERDKTESESYVKEYQDYFLNGTASPGILAEYALVKKDLPAISLSDVNALCAAYIKDTDRDIVIQAPEADKANLPDEATVLGWIKNVEQEDLKPYNDDATDKPLLALQPLPGPIINKKFNKVVGTTEWTLSNGLKVILKPTTFKNDEISFTAFAPGGTSVYNDADYQSAANSSAIIPACGLGEFNADQLQKLLSGKQVSVAPYIGERSQGISGSSTVKDLETALQLTYLYFTAPRKDEGMFQNIIARSKAGLNDRANDPGSVYSDTVSAVLGNYNMRRTGPTPEKVDQVNLDRAYEIFKERFADASGFTFVFVGNIDTIQIKPLLEKYLGSLPATNKNEQSVDLHIHAPAGQLAKTVYRGSEPKATVDLVFSGDYDFNSQNNTQLKALAEVLEIRLLERLREDESGVYTPSASASVEKYPSNRYGFYIHFGCAPKNVDKLIASAMDEIEKLKTSGPPQINIDKYKAEHQRGMELALKTNDFWLGYLDNQYENKENLDQVFHDADDMAKLTPASLKEAAQKYLGINCIKFVLMPEKK